MLTFAAAVFFLMITPGPGVLSAAGVGSAFGARAGTRYLVGLLLGNFMVSLVVVSGIATVLLADSRIRTVLFVVSTGYLLYLALRIAFAGSRVAFIVTDRPPGIANGIVLQIINPKAFAVNTALFSGFSFLPGDLFTETLLKFAIINVIWIPIHILWLWFGVKLRRLDLSERTHRAINIAMSLSMLAVVALAVGAFTFGDATLH